METDLILDVARSLLAVGGACQFDQIETAAAVGQIAAHLIDDVGSTWWWSSLKERATTLSYGQADGLELIRLLLPEDQVVLFVVSDDQPASDWRVFGCRLSDVLQILTTQRFFEFIIVDPNYRWAVFDTHHNALVVAGTLSDRATELEQTLRAARP